MRDVIFKIINQFTKGVDTYHNNRSMWLIFTDDKKWVIELTEDGILWYNFYFFQDCFKYLSLDVVENQHYITEWVESTIQNGVKSTSLWNFDDLDSVEDIIQNGVKHTLQVDSNRSSSVESIIQNWVRHTGHNVIRSANSIEDVIKNGIKETNWRKVDNHPTYVDNIIK